MAASVAQEHDECAAEARSEQPHGIERPVVVVKHATQRSVVLDPIMRLEEDARPAQLDEVQVRHEVLVADDLVAA